MRIETSTKSHDWHPADVIAELHKRGWSLRALGRANGYSPNSLRRALRHPWPKAERIIAEAVGLPPQEIWPSRYLGREHAS